jgi:hypothetical protein
MKRIRFILGGTGAAAVALLILIFFLGCKKQDEKNGIVGKVSVADGSASGVTIELYDYPSFVSSSAWDVAATHPSVGFPYSLSAGFDRRRESTHLVSTTTTGSDGSFNIANLTNGQYVIVARADSFGWSAPLRADLAGSKLDVGTLSLYHETVIPQNTLLQTDTRWLSGHHYILNGDMVVGEGATLTVEPGAVIRFLGDGESITVLGSMACEGTPQSFILFTSNQSTPALADWNRISFDAAATPPLFRYCAFSYGETAVLSSAKGATIDHCYFAYLNSEAVDVQGSLDGGGDSVLVRNNVIDHIAVSIQVVAAKRSGTDIEHNIIITPGNWGVNLDGVYGGAVNCNWFYKCGADTTAGHETGAIKLGDASDLMISHNEFLSSWWGFSVVAQVDSSVMIRNNHFSHLNRVLSLSGGANGHPSFPTLRVNCADHIDGYFIFYGVCFFNFRDMDADSNYWGGAAGSSLDNRIIDCIDDRTCGCVTRAIVLPSCPDGVGLCSE